MAIEELDPAACSLWSLHQRLGEDIDAESCADLLESVRAHGQCQPVLGRPVQRKDGISVELIYGARRLFVAQQLGIKLRVDVRALDDRSALVEMDLENRVRSDISPYERGLSYRRWLGNAYFRNQTELAEALAVSEAQVSRLLRYAELPAAVVAAFESGRVIREEWAVVLAKSCREPQQRQQVLRRAREYVRGEKRCSPQRLFALLIGDQQQKDLGQRALDEVIKDDYGAPLARVAFRANTVHFVIPRERASDQVLAEIRSRLKAVLGPPPLDNAGRARPRPSLHRGPSQRLEHAAEQISLG